MILPEKLSSGYHTGQAVRAGNFIPPASANSGKFVPIHFGYAIQI